MGQAKEIERLLNKYLNVHKKCIEQERVRKAMEEKGLPQEIIQQVLKQVSKII